MNREQFRESLFELHHKAAMLKETTQNPEVRQLSGYIEKLTRLLTELIEIAKQGP